MSGAWSRRQFMRRTLAAGGAVGASSLLSSSMPAQAAIPAPGNDEQASAMLKRPMHNGWKL
jgi:hypothetical protein